MGNKTGDEIKIKNQAIIKTILEANRIRTSKTLNLSIWGQKLAEHKGTRIQLEVWLRNRKDEDFLLSMVDANFALIKLINYFEALRSIDMKQEQ